MKVNIPGFSKYFVEGIRTAEIEGKTVNECLKNLSEQFPKIRLFDKEGELYADLGVYVNGEFLKPTELDKPVEDKDELSVILMFVGG